MPHPPIASAENGSRPVVIISKKTLLPIGVVIAIALGAVAATKDRAGVGEAIRVNSSMIQMNREVIHETCEKLDAIQKAVTWMKADMEARAAAESGRHGD